MICAARNVKTCHLCVVGNNFVHYTAHTSLLLVVLPSIFANRTCLYARARAFIYVIGKKMEKYFYVQCAHIFATQFRCRYYAERILKQLLRCVVVWRAIILYVIYSVKGKLINSILYIVIVKYDRKYALIFPGFTKILFRIYRNIIRSFYYKFKM